MRNHSKNTLIDRADPKKAFASKIVSDDEDNDAWGQMGGSLDDAIKVQSSSSDDDGDRKRPKKRTAVIKSEDEMTVGDISIRGSSSEDDHLGRNSRGARQTRMINPRCNAGTRASIASEPDSMTETKKRKRTPKNMKEDQQVRAEPADFDEPQGSRMFGVDVPVLDESARGYHFDNNSI